MTQIKQYNAVTGETIYVDLEPEEQARLDAFDPVPGQYEVLRIERNKRLAETDYLALSDSTLTDEMRTYRQALRDLPANTTDPASPVWPTKPEVSE